MKPLPLLILLTIFIVFAFTVKKEKPTASPIPGNCCEFKWKGTVSIPDAHASKNVYILPESNYIANGYAQLLQRFGSYYRWWSGIELDMPCTAEVSADNVKLEWYGISDVAINANEADVGMVLTGDKDRASVNCMLSFRPEYCALQYGKIQATAVPEVVVDVDNWNKYSLEISNNTLKFAVNGVVKKQLKGDQKLGVLKNISLSFKGSGKIDWVKLYEKDKLIMQEDFNVPGKSSVKWH